MTTSRKAKIFFGITFLGTRLKSATKPPDGLDGLRPDPLTVRSVKAGVQGTEFKLSWESYLLTFWFFTRERNEIISSNVAVCVHERPVFALLFLLRIKIFNSDSSRFRNESKGNFQPREYLLFE